MAVEYDLVIIGGGSTGRHAAAAAAHSKARVALVEPPQPDRGWSLSNQALVEVGRAAHHMRSAAQFGVFPITEASVQGVSTRIGWVMQWVKTVVSTLSEQHSSAALAALGVEVILGTGQFHNQPRLAFSVNGRQLRARTYLIATGVYYPQPDIEGSQTTRCLTPDNLLQKQWSQWPEDLVVIGGGPISIELSQTFARLGSHVTLMVDGPRILAQEDPEAASWVQAQLEAEGIRVLTHSRVTQIGRVNSKKLILAGEQAIAASEVLFTVGQRPNVEFLNLGTVGVKLSQRGIQVNDKLQTSNPRIYACGEVIGGYPLTHIANHEAQIALKNALFLPIFQVDYRVIPWAIFSDPELARIGLTEAQARQRYGQEVRVLRQFYKTMERAQLQGQTTGFCKIIVRQDGTILGAYLVGPAAGEVIHAIALAMKHRLKVKTLSDLVHISPTLAEVNCRTAAVWDDISQQPARQNFLESFFNLRRAWSS